MYIKNTQKMLTFWGENSTTCLNAGNKLSLHGGSILKGWYKNEEKKGEQIPIVRTGTGYVTWFGHGHVSPGKRIGYSNF